jgi:hypothetical protein
MNALDQASTLAVSIRVSEPELAVRLAALLEQHRKSHRVKP